MPDVTPEAVLAAAHEVLLEGGNDGDGCAESDYALARMMLEAAAPHIRPVTRDEIIKRLVKAFGEHRAYDPATRSYVPDGNDAEGNPSVSFVAADGYLSVRTATYGEIADALTGGDQ